MPITAQEKNILDKPLQQEKSVSTETKIKDFSENNGQIYAEFLHNDEVVTAPVIRDSEEKAHIDYDGISYELNKLQLEDLNNYELYRAPITHDLNGFYAEELEVGDKIKLDGAEWKIASVKDYSIRLENDVDNKKHFFGNWQEQLTKAGFEYIESEEQPEIDEPIFAEPAVEHTEVESLSQGEQLSQSDKLKINPEYYKSLPKKERVINTEPKNVADKLMKQLEKTGVQYSAVARTEDSVAITVSQKDIAAYQAAKEIAQKEHIREYINPDYYKSLDPQERFTQRMGQDDAEKVLKSLDKQGVQHSAILYGEKSMVTVEKSNAKQLTISRKQLHNQATKISQENREKQPEKNRKQTQEI